ncbi:pentapeptide repeat-containing protein [Hyalangium rubrum]|uniref:Pentapeptide repeat-containing protein n=1 Tax=Hyalangium rubrum TaxID=3103134 RepID=A0ABU5GYD0_9BACT|nr:pentapeptide repeat-containing protein [Hyalangium sp. s54d21]MDY7226205.1 pentapeptide repeat-containing protein [Hyalangium sp. s54d21]
MWLNNVIFEDKVIENERLELTAKDALYYLGPKLTLRHCTLVLQVPARRLLLAGPQLMDCTIEVKTELKNLPWYTASLRGCRFTGKLTGNDFGYYPNPALPDRDMGRVEDCDFSRAQLHGCRFIGCDVSTLKFPRWPWFTLLHPYKRARELAALPWPGQLSVAMSGFTDIPATTEALTRSATVLAKQFETTEEAIKATLALLDDVIY